MDGVEYEDSHAALVNLSKEELDAILEHLDKGRTLRNINIMRMPWRHDVTYWYTDGSHARLRIPIVNPTGAVIE